MTQKEIDAYQSVINTFHVLDIPMQRLFQELLDKLKTVVAERDKAQDILTDYLTPSTPSPQLLTSRDTGVWFFECCYCGTDACVVNLDSLSQAFLVVKQAGWHHTADGQEIVCPECVERGALLVCGKDTFGW